MRILCITSGLNGILNASFELVKRLQHAGIDCVCASPANVGSNVRAQKLEFIPLGKVNYDPAPELPIFSGSFIRIKRYLYKLIHYQKRLDQAVNNLHMDDFMDRIRKEQFDLIVIDIELHEHIMTLVANGHHVLLLSQWFSLWKRKGLPPIIDSTIPGKGLSGSKVGIEMRWIQIKWQRWWIFMKKRFFSFGTDRRSVLLEYARRIGFKPDYIPDNFWPGPFNYDQLPVISMTSELLEFPHDLRSNYYSVGPMTNVHRIEINSNLDVNQKITSIIKEAKNDNRKIIYCSVSTFKQGDYNFINKVIQCVGEHDEWILIVGLGGKMDPAQLGNVPNNVFVFQFVPQLKVLRSADLSINHGGIHTINECVHFGVPMLVYSGKRSDQNGCAARVKYHGIGDIGDKDNDSPQEIGEKIRYVMSNSEYSRKLKSIIKPEQLHLEKERLLEVVNRLVYPNSNDTIKNHVSDIALEHHSEMTSEQMI